MRAYDRRNLILAPNRARPGGFTLVELLVVIGIIAVLMAILLPVISRAGQQAQVTQCAALMREIVHASIMYANDNKGYLPPLRQYRGDKGIPGGFGSFANAGVLQDNSWNNSSEVGANIGRLVGMKYLGNIPADRNPPDAPYYECPSAQKNPGDNNRFAYFYNFHMKADPQKKDLWRIWPRIPGYGKTPNGDMTLYNLATGATTTGTYPNVPRAIVTDPVYGHVSGGRAYATHNLRSSMAFNLGFADGSVRTAFAKADTQLPNSGEYKQIISIIQYLEQNLGGNTPTDGFDYPTYADIPMML
jgi:prepilin-type N-terminal cleavage/methylation domain-containing protein